MSKLAIASFALGDRVRPTSGPYSRIDFTVVAVKGDRISVEFAKLKLVFPAKLLKPTPKPKAKARANQLIKVEKVPPEAEITVKIEPALLGAPFAEITITYLECEITQIEAEGCVAPVGCWIEEYTAFDGVSRHVRYNSRAPMFLGKRSGGMVRKSAIGKANSHEHQQAKDAIARRNRIQALRRQIKALGGD